MVLIQEQKHKNMSMKKMALMQILAASAMMNSNGYSYQTGRTGTNLQDAVEQENERKRQAKIKQPELNKNKGLKQWAEFGDVWAATKKAAKKKYAKMVAENHR